jgi:hypothetical protein
MAAFEPRDSFGFPPCQLSSTLPSTSQNIIKLPRKVGWYALSWRSKIKTEIETDPCNYSIDGSNRPHHVSCAQKQYNEIMALCGGPPKRDPLTPIGERAKETLKMSESVLRPSTLPSSLPHHIPSESNITKHISIESYNKKN